MNDETILINDAKLAKLVSMSPSWVRGQRYKRRHGLPHELTVDEVLVGRTPRYVLADVRQWLAGLIEPQGEPA